MFVPECLQELRDQRQSPHRPPSKNANCRDLRSELLIFLPVILGGYLKMKKQHILVVLVFVLTCLMSACATSEGEAIPASIVRHPQTSPAAVKILFENPSEKYEVIGQVVAIAEFSSDQKLYEELKKQAGKLGADAVVVKRDGGSTFGGLRRKSTGIAIRFK